LEAAAKQPIQAEQAPPTEDGILAKRKREEEAEVNGVPTKKARPEGETKPQEEAIPTPVKRDRENATVFVENLPREISEVKVRQFFRDVSIIRLHMR
jgi:RNA recognition motif-containing protein